MKAPDDPLLPFWIDWAPDTEHPGTHAPPGCSVERLLARDPDPDRARSYLEQLDLDLEVERADAPALVAMLKTPRGSVTLTT